ncbi:hypothetical protein [Streptomyces sp. NPDC054887]
MTADLEQQAQGFVTLLRSPLGDHDARVTVATEQEPGCDPIWGDDGYAADQLVSSGYMLRSLYGAMTTTLLHQLVHRGRMLRPPSGAMTTPDPEDTHCSHPGLRSLFGVMMTLRLLLHPRHELMLRSLLGR